MPDLATITEEHSNRGQNDARPVAMVTNVAKAAANAVTNKLDPLVEIYAQMFANGVRTPVLRRRSTAPARWVPTGSRWARSV